MNCLQWLTFLSADAFRSPIDSVLGREVPVAFRVRGCHPASFTAALDKYYLLSGIYPTISLTCCIGSRAPSPTFSPARETFLLPSARTDLHGWFGWEEAAGYI